MYILVYINVSMHPRGSIADEDLVGKAVDAAHTP
ncbi:MAG: hypothetical protein GFH27_549301n15 [Chloroflexi bacterium AL-W]|nr:hypothetical protein [Chloroflexi bacterium AL-N1]NOK68208.1 hypothetical protein [Chloroflexi bacterium AL-N10]NOK73854.1 hypothetical protein [Chloroflexi bacterium AL-N5]NOK82822.1 hypothetical protein [Chloroflexi bacterium AL-W]NOK90344.1 hypothetical protein [Chloroflexi bacterium AL-N15]